MGEHTIVEVADALNGRAGRVQDITYIDGTVYRSAKRLMTACTHLSSCCPRSPSMQKDDRRSMRRELQRAVRQQRPLHGQAAGGALSDNVFVVQNPPQKPLTTAEMDAVYDLPYMRALSPQLRKGGGRPRH